jgi:hypothetical protein
MHDPSAPTTVVLANFILDHHRLRTTEGVNNNPDLLTIALAVSRANPHDNDDRGLLG